MVCLIRGRLNRVIGRVEVNILQQTSEEHELFPDVTDHLVGSDLEDVEVDGLSEGSALTDNGDVSDLDVVEGRGAVGNEVAVALLVPVVLGDVVKVVTSDDNGPLHFGADDDSLEDLSSDVDVAGEGAFLIDIVALDGLLGGLEVETNVLVVPSSGRGLLSQQLLAVQEDSVLLLEGAFVLNRPHLTWMSAMATEYQIFQSINPKIIFILLSLPPPPISSPGRLSPLRRPSRNRWPRFIIFNYVMVRIIENYTLYEIIGEGAYGKVFRAINKLDNKEYAVKVIEVRRFKENKKLEECTVNEINILTNIEKNEHIIKYIDMLKTPNNFYFVYEYCNGGTLEGMLRKERVIPEKQALLIFKQLIEAFQVLNKYNIMHRDLKPDNIFFNQGLVKLGDFGFCKSLEKANMTKTMLGSPIYMAPEILRGEIYSTKADIWSLGVVLYEMLYGFCPFESTTIPKLIEVLKETELEFPNKETVSDETKRLVRKLLTKDPTKRIEWMELLRVNIASDGRLVSNKQERLSLVEEDGGLDNAKLAESTKLNFSQTKKPAQNTSNSTQSYSPPSAYNSEPNLNNPNQAQGSTPGASFLKKKNTYEGATNPSFGQSNPRRNSAAQMGEGNEIQNPVSSGNSSIKRTILKEHGEATRGLHIAVDIIKSNDTNGVLFAYLILKKAQQKLVTVRDEVANQPEFKELVMCLNSQLKEINVELGKYNINENPQNWRALIKATGEFHRNYRAFYMMVVFLGGEIPREDLSHVEMQLQVRGKLY